MDKDDSTFIGPISVDQNVSVTSDLGDIKPRTCTPYITSQFSIPTKKNCQTITKQIQNV